MRGLTVGSLLAFLAAGSIAAAEDLEFASKKEEIIQALQGKDGLKLVDGETYELKGGQVYHVLPSGMKVKLRGLGGVVQTSVSPRVALPIEFEFNSDEPTAPGKKVLAELGAALVSPQLQGASFVIAGHTDSVGEDALNLDLSKRRAEAIKRYLASKHRIPEGSLSVKACGETQPIASNQTEEGRARNRRVEVTRLLTQ